VGWIQDDGDKSVQQAGYSPAPSAPLALPPISDFSADVLTSCDGIFNFSDQSALFPTSWSWNFGDGVTSTLQNPSHKYNASGVYNVQLTATNANGNNIATKTSYVAVSLLGTAPNGVSAKRCGSGVVNLSASPVSGGTLNWYNSVGTLVNTGTNYSPTIIGSASFAVAEMTPNSLTNTGRIDSALGGGGFFTTNTVHGLYFDVAKPCKLVSVVTYANAAGNRTIQVLDASGTIINTAVVNIPTGMSTVTLNFPLAAGTGYFIKIATGSTVALYRNNANASYPYSSGVVTVTGNDAGPAYYYYFYDWKVRQNDCASPSAIVTGTDSCAGIGINNVSITNSLSVFPNPVSDFVNVQITLPETETANVSLYNVAGALVYKGVINATQNQLVKLAIPVSEMNAGMYLLKIETNGTTLYRKIIK
jgi:PKD repeat protein